MEYKFSRRSLERMNGLNEKLIELLELAIKRTPIDFGIAWYGGFRTEAMQAELFNMTPKVTTKDGIIKKSKHQSGLAVDLQPYVHNKPNAAKQNYLVLAGVMFACANELGLKLRSGMDWDMDSEYLTDQTFDDYPHFEIIL
jgi:peptidoglycan L-alanyl-D-glutamate endopeptidase CwlK